MFWCTCRMAGAVRSEVYVSLLRAIVDLRQTNDFLQTDLAVMLGRGAVRLMRTSIGVLAQPKSMRSIDDATRQEQRHGSA